MRLEKYRKEKGLTQSKLAKMLNLGRSTIAMWECGKSRPSIDDLHKLATIYQTSIENLIGIDKTQSAEICKRIKGLMDEQKGMDVTRLSSQTGIPLFTINNIYTGFLPDLNIDEINLIAKYLNSSKAYIVNGDESQKYNKLANNEVTLIFNRLVGDSSTEWEDKDIKSLETILNKYYTK